MVHHTATEPCLVGNVNEVVSVSSPEEEYLWEDHSTRIFFDSTAVSASIEVAFSPCNHGSVFRIPSQS